MTDEEMAEEYKADYGIDLCCLCRECEVENIIPCQHKKDAMYGYKDGFLAGLKAGRPQWHKVADGDLPKDEDYKCCISSNGVYYVARYEELFVSWTNQENKEVCCPYAWQEIIPPKESE